MSEYVPSEIESKWQKHWLENKTFRTPDESPKPKFYALDMFPYPSGDGLHVGHPEGYTATDIVCRYKRMKGFNVLHPMGWDAFGLPAEQHAIQTGTHPSITTEKNVSRFREQIRALGFSYDWDREISTASPEYYRWTQWIFLKLYEKGLAYQSFEPVNWCEALGTVLANEEVIDGKSERGGHPVVKKPMRQWVLKITEYAERLLQDLEGLDWPVSILEMQKNWIGKSTGAEIEFKIKGHTDSFTVFTTRPDTLSGATFCVLAPEHPLVAKISTKPEVQKYVDTAKAKSEIDRTSADREKTGVFTGAMAVHPMTGADVPIWIADYVLASYGKGAIMAVPAHDERDKAFAEKYGLPIVKAVEDDADPTKPIAEMCAWLEKNGKGKAAVTYKLRDWLFSRQRYWGEPFPIAFDKNGGVHALKESDLPVRLPQLQDFRPSGDGQSPLAKATDWLQVDGMTRETNTMPQWAGSCWYYLRYLDPKNDKAAWDPKKEKYWMPVDLYIGGAEHAVLHLLYARFWHKVLFDLGFVSAPEPFRKLVNQGMILGENGEKMSKSRGNVVNPDDVIREWGADSLRMYEMFMGPLEQTKPWQTAGIGGCFRFLKRAWKLFDSVSETEADEITKLRHKTIKKVGEDIEGLRLNTGISAMMELVNLIYKHEMKCSRATLEALCLIVSPYAPHFGEELWQRLGHTTSLAYEPWPTFDPALVVDDTVKMAVQINGKVRAEIEIPKNADQATVLATAKAHEKFKEHTAGKTIVREIYVPGKILNFVCK